LCVGLETGTIKKTIYGSHFFRVDANVNLESLEQAVLIPTTRPACMAPLNKTPYNYREVTFS